MYKKLTYLLFYFVISNTSVGQQSYKITYKHSIEYDTTKYLTTDYGLEAVLTGGSEASNYNFLKSLPDSLLIALRNAPKPEDMFKERKSGNYQTVLGSMPDTDGTMAYWKKTTDSIMVREKTTYDYIVTREKRPVIKWTISNETKKIKDYNCIKATCYFRGRNYTAWFTPDIGIADGPWKFKGLPGLIMEIADENWQVKVVAEKIELLSEVQVPPFVNRGKKISIDNYFQYRNKERKKIEEKMDALILSQNDGLPKANGRIIKPIIIRNQIINCYSIEKRMN